SNVASPDHLYNGSGLFDVDLMVTNADGCSNTSSQQVFISPKPEVDFGFDIPCVGNVGTQFNDLSTVGSSDITGWSWRVNGVERSTLPQPILVFDTPGQTTIELEVTSSNGCKESMQQDLTILESPEPNFEIQMGCDGEAFTFFNSTPDATGFSYAWSVEDALYTTADASHVFSAPGMYEVMLEVTGANLCVNAGAQQVEVLELPEPSFSFTGSCTNEIIEAQDQSTSSNDPIAERIWLLDDQPVGSGATLILANQQEGIYTLTLQLETQQGCIVETQQSLTIDASPTAALSTPRAFGVPGDQLLFENTSSGFSQRRWFLDNVLVAESGSLQEIVFQEPGNYVVRVEAENSLGCIATAYQEVLIAIPQIDVSIANMEFFENGSEGIVRFDVINNSNLPIDETSAIVTLENQFSVTTPIDQLIGIGETTNVRLDVAIPVIQGPTYFCVELVSQFDSTEDLDPLNNEACITIEPSITVEPPFPNPAQKEVTFRAVFPLASSINLFLINSTGKIVRREVRNVGEGLSTFFFDLETLPAGIYFIRMETSSEDFQQKVIKF
ncbi:MAG: T9SS type A sorting domain-containing protein, partial [Bacteroidota bacterium]